MARPAFEEGLPRIKEDRRERCAPGSAGNPETTCGNALKFYASVRLDIRKTGVVKNGAQAVDNKTYAHDLKLILACYSSEDYAIYCLQVLTQWWRQPPRCRWAKVAISSMASRASRNIGASMG